MSIVRRVWGALIILAALSIGYDLYGAWTAGGIETRWSVFVSLFLVSVFLSGLGNMLGMED